MTMLAVNDLRFEVRRSPRRRALEITVDRGGELIISAPQDAPDADLRATNVRWDGGRIGKCHGEGRGEHGGDEGNGCQQHLR